MKNTITISLCLILFLFMSTVAFSVQLMPHSKGILTEFDASGKKIKIIPDHGRHEWMYQGNSSIFSIDDHHTTLEEFFRNAAQKKITVYYYESDGKRVIVHALIEKN